MNNRKNQNSILVLATLGVYLGLVLAGATPQVLAQAATAKQFSVKDEVEVKDDLEKKPDDCDKFAAKAKDKQQRFPFEDNAFFSYAEALASIASTVEHINSTQFHFSSRAYGDSRLPEYVSIKFDGKPILFPANTRPKLENEILVLSHVFPTTNLDSQERFRFEFALDTSDFVSSAKFLRYDETDAHQAFIAYDSLLDLWRCIAKTPREILLSKNSEVTWTNNQVIVVTRLPRAGLDTLLATDAR